MERHPRARPITPLSERALGPVSATRRGSFKLVYPIRIIGGGFSPAPGQPVAKRPNKIREALQGRVKVIHPLSF